MHNIEKLLCFIKTVKTGSLTIREKEKVPIRITGSKLETKRRTNTSIKPKTRI